MNAPDSFVRDVRDAERKRQAGKLGLLAVEAQQYAWKVEGMRLAARALCGVESFRLGSFTWKSVLASKPQDEEANKALAWLEMKLTGSAQMAGAGEQRWEQAILFTGHRIDAPGRKQPRFPARAEAAANDAILRSLQLLSNEKSEKTTGIAGGASGGDILFHECCGRLGIPTLLLLTLPEEAFVASSVAGAGAGWVSRFHALLDRLPPGRVQVLGETAELPPWMTQMTQMTETEHPYDVWQRTNLWLIQEAIASAPRQILLAMWDGQPGDGPGGTQHLLETAPAYGVTIAPLISMQDLTAS